MHHRPQRLRAIGRLGVGDSDPQPRLVTRRAGELRDELGERLPVPAHLLQRHDFAVADGQDRLDVQQLARHRGSLADAAAAAQELERVDREQQPGLALVPIE
jgi:hypothetical protein